MVAEPKLDPREWTYRISGPHPDLQLVVCHLPVVVRPDDRVRHDEVPPPDANHRHNRWG